MKNFENKKVAISGGGSGIGKSLIAELYKAGTRDFAVIGRSADKLEALKNEFPEARFILFSGDVSKPQDLKEFTKEIENKWKALDLLINNAGIVSAGPIGEISDEDIISQVNTNVTGLILLTKYALPLLKESKEAAILNVSSNLALIGLPFYAPYAATKGAVKVFSEALRRELKDFPIQVATLYPTGTDTPMMTSSQSQGLHSSEMVAQKAIEGLKNNDIDITLGDAENIKLNRENPVEFDKKAASMYDAMKKRTENHRSM
ncbi:SDR family NAD(P)-dependent oxidoreductase [Halpernia frigidisoli]|uniref:Short-chain dehydrogenase n=1 Tax=Halpernia frigidisoli TaxID=1125876 RepID=A0A1I3CQ32_9FLAO|nr:SDR family NAD(P)-dependent oxidoreductase [Halpernia frigidisoli]SFH76597.1 Short-chain dehydrogenase [Halpernia frigidisoli]